MSEQVGKKAILFDVDDTLYDQTVPFMEAYAEYFGEKPEVPAEVIYPVTRKYSDAVYSQAMAGEMTMEEMYIYRMQKAFEEFGIRITDQEALDFPMRTASIIFICRRSCRTYWLSAQEEQIWGSSQTVLHSISGIR